LYTMVSVAAMENVQARLDCLDHNHTQSWAVGHAFGRSNVGGQLGHSFHVFISTDRQLYIALASHIQTPDEFEWSIDAVIL